MKVLTLESYFAPEQYASSRLVSDYYEAFANYGFDTVIYTPSPTRGVSDEVRKQYRKRHKSETLYNGKTTVHRFALYREGKSPVLRALRYLIACIKHFYYGCRNKNADVLFVTSTPPIQGAMAVLVKKITGVPVVYNLQDIFPDSLVGTGLAKKNSVIWKIGRKIEDFTYRNVDKIIVPSEDFKQNIVNKGVLPQKVELIYNWVDENLIVPVDKDDNPLFEELHIERNKFHIVYAGNLGYAQNVKVLLQAADILRNEQGIEFLIFGTGGLKQEYEKFVKENDLDNVKFYPLQPLDKVSQVYSLADASLVSCKKGLGGSAMPSKTWSILATKTPVLCSFDKDGELQRIIEQHQLGLFSDADDAHGLTQNIMTLYQHQELCELYGNNGRKFIEQNLTKEAGTSRYIKALKDTAVKK